MNTSTRRPAPSTLAPAALMSLSAVLLCTAPAASQTTDELYQRACDRGDISACALFATMLELGEGVPQDDARAAGLFSVACNGGDPQSCTNLGRMYEEGVGVEVDLLRARSNYRIGCDGGIRDGCDYLTMLALIHPGLGEALYVRSIRVVDAETDEILSDALIAIPSLGVRGPTNAEGRLVLRDLPEGFHELRVERVGYEPIRGTFDARGVGEIQLRLDPIDISEPGSPGAIVGRVRGEANQPLELVQITLPGDADRVVVTDTDGRFALDGVTPGLTELRITRIGYAPRTVSLIVQPGETTEIVAPLSTQAIELAPIEVVAHARRIELEHSPYLDRIGFYDRELRGWGNQFSRQYMEENLPEYVYDMVKYARGVRIRLNQVTKEAVAVNPRITSFLGPDACALEVFIDGVKSSDTNVNQISPFNLEGVEVYSGVETPIEYVTGNPCGVVLLWTRR